MIKTRRAAPHVGTAAYSPSLEQHCPIHYAYAYMRIMRADKWAHTYMKIVKLIS